MNFDFYQHILERQQKVEAVPPNEVIAGWAVQLIRLLYPEQAKKPYENVEQIRDAFESSRSKLVGILNDTKACSDCNNDKVAASFFERVPTLYEMLHKDAQAILQGDPAAISEFEVIRTYPG